MRLVFLCGPPCSGKTTMAHTLAVLERGDVVIDYDDIARDLGSPDRWQHVEPWRTQAEQEMQHAITRAHHTTSTGTAWVIRTAPRPAHRQRLAQTYKAPVYLLDPGEPVCRQRAAQRPSGTARSIGTWYHRYTPWGGDLDPVALDPTWSGVHQVDRGMVAVDPSTI
jgi:predicted kinase